MANQNQNPARNHHYLPQRYQNGFTKDGLIWVYDGEEGEFRPLPPKVNAVVRDFYSLDGLETVEPDGLESLKSDVLEKELGGLEQRVWPLIDRLSDRHPAISASEKRELSLFFAFLYTRVPVFEDRLNNSKAQHLRSWVEEVFATPDDLADKVKEATGESLPADQIGRLHAELPRGLTIESSRHNNLVDILDVTPIWAESFFNRAWEVLTAPREVAYILCDNPVVLVHPQGGMVDHADPELRVLIPLTSKNALRMSHFGADHSISRTCAGSGFVRNLNIAIAQNGDRFVMARDELHLRRVVAKARLDSTRASSGGEQEESHSVLAERTHP
jgi:hypothetical protein